MVGGATTTGDWDALVTAERKRQDAEWGYKPRRLERLMVILAEEYGELARAVLSRTNIDEEVIHVAAVCKLIWDTGRDWGYETEKGLVAL